MVSDEAKRNRILEYAFKKFSTVGVSQVTMDDLARGIGMGKGTLYKYFPSKEMLLENTFKYVISSIDITVEAIIGDEKLTTAEKLSKFLKTIVEKLSMINPAALANIERNMPELYDRLEKVREGIITKNLLRLFQEGKRNGLFDPDLDDSIVVQMLIGAVNHITRPNILMTLNYSIDQIFNKVTGTLLKGCLTPEGKMLTYPTAVK